MASIHKRERAGFDPSYRVRWYEDGKQREKTFSKRRLALAHKQRMEREVEGKDAAEGAVAGALQRVESGVCMTELGSQFIEASRIGREGRPPLEPVTLYTYERCIERFFMQAFGDVPVQNMTRGDCREAREEILRLANSRGTAKRVFNLAKTILNWAVDDLELMDDNPMGRLKIEEDKRTTRRKIKVHSREEMKKIILAARARHESDIKSVREAWRTYYPLLLFLIHTGVRSSEAFALKFSDFNDRLTEFEVSRKIARYVPGVTRETRVGRVKSTHALRAIGVPEHVAELLRDLQKTATVEWVFPNSKGGPKSYDTVKKYMWKVLLDDTGVTRIGMHSLRHYYASLLLARGFLGELRTLLGHHSTAFTLAQYTDMIDDIEKRRQEVAGRLEVELSEILEVEAEIAERTESDASDSGIRSMLG